MKRILFVDDDARILDGIRRMLRSKRNEWEVEVALGGEAALKACETRSFDVIVSDMRMPFMDGAMLLSRVKETYPAMARIILSGYSDKDAANRALSVAHRFIAKPCDPEELQITVESVCALQSILTAPELRQIGGGIGNLPSLSSTYHELGAAITGPDVSIDQIARIVEKDPAISAKLLQLVNSAFFGLRQDVTSIHGAVSYLGINTIVNLALVVQVFRVFQPSTGIAGQVIEQMWDHAHRTAVLAGRLPVKGGMRDMTVIAALLHDVGKLALASAAPKKFEAVFALAKSKGCKLVDAELESLGTTHAELGAYVMGLWGIPSIAVEAIAHHHCPRRVPHSGFDPTVAVFVANVLDHGSGTLTRPLSKEALVALFDPEDLEGLGLAGQMDGLVRILEESAPVAQKPAEKHQTA